MSEWDRKLPETSEEVIALLERRIEVHEAWAAAIDRGEADDAVSAGVGTVESHRCYARQYRTAQDIIRRSLLQLSSAQEKIEWLREQVDYHVNDKCRMNMEKTASYVELQSRLETALKWIEAVRSCDGDRWECSVCGHSEPWWTHSNADELTKDIAVERREPMQPSSPDDAIGKRMQRGQSCLESMVEGFSLPLECTCTCGWSSGQCRDDCWKVKEWRQATASDNR